MFRHLSLVIHEGSGKNHAHFLEVFRDYLTNRFDFTSEQCANVPQAGLLYFLVSRIGSQMGIAVSNLRQVNTTWQFHRPLCSQLGVRTHQLAKHIFSLPAYSEITGFHYDVGWYKFHSSYQNVPSWGGRDICNTFNHNDLNKIAPSQSHVTLSS